jgi:hypothetical protein
VIRDRLCPEIQLTGMQQYLPEASAYPTHHPTLSYAFAFYHLSYALSYADLRYPTLSYAFAFPPGPSRELNSFDCHWGPQSAESEDPPKVLPGLPDIKLKHYPSPILRVSYAGADIILAIRDGPPQAQLTVPDPPECNHYPTQHPVPTLSYAFLKNSILRIILRIAVRRHLSYA